MGYADHTGTKGIYKVQWINVLNKPTGIDDYGTFGNVSNNTSFDATGHQTMIGNARPWRDEVGDVLSLKVSGTGITDNAAESTIDFDYNAVYSATFAAADMLRKNVQLNHDKDLTSTIYPHIHWMQAKNYSPNFLLGYRWQRNGNEKVTAWTLLKCNNLAFTFSGFTTLHQISYSAGIPVPTGTQLSDIVQFRIYRDTSDASGLFSVTCPYNTGGNASTPILSFDCHFMINSLGSTDELSK